VVDLAEIGPPIELPGIDVIRTEGPRQWLALPRGVNAAAVVAKLADRHEILDISLREPDIEDVVTRLYKTGLPTQ
jgi:ABC-2 type transport system ATP-binding protein